MAVTIEAGIGDLVGRGGLPEAIATDGRQQMMLTSHVNERLHIHRLRHSWVFRTESYSACVAVLSHFNAVE